MMRHTKADALLEALPYFQQFRGRTVVIKYGGAAMENPELVESVMRDIVFLEAVGINPVVVHGGGKAITAAMRQENLTARFVDGFRYTDEASIRIIDRVLTEVISPALAAKVRELGGKAKILSGKEVLVAEKAPPREDATGAKLDLGFVGNIVSIDAAKVQKLIKAEIVPIISPLGRGRDGQVHASLMYPAPSRDRALGVADDRAIAEDGRAGGDVDQSDLVRLGDVFEQREAGVEARARGQAALVDEDRHRVARVDLHIQGTQLRFGRHAVVPRIFLRGGAYGSSILPSTRRSRCSGFASCNGSGSRSAGKSW